MPQAIRDRPAVVRRPNLTPESTAALDMRISDMAEKAAQREKPLSAKTVTRGALSCRIGSLDRSIRMATAKIERMTTERTALVAERDTAKPRDKWIVRKRPRDEEITPRARIRLVLHRTRISIASASAQQERIAKRLEELYATLDAALAERESLPPERRGWLEKLKGDALDA